MTDENAITNFSERNFKKPLYCNGKDSELDPWDESPEMWDAFETKHSPYKNIMNDLVNFSNISPEDKVLDLGCGTGRLAILIKIKYSSVKLFLLDKSYKMIEYAKKNLFDKFGDLKNIEFVISDATSIEPLKILHSSIGLNKIIFNHTFHHVCNSVRDIEAICKKWKRYLLKNGAIIICLHNSVVKFPKSSKYGRWKDPLKAAIRSYAISNNIELIEQFAGFSISEIKKHFAKEGFYLSRIKVSFYERLMEDRLDMWRVPGIFKRFLNLHSTHYDKYYDYLGSIYKEIVSKKTERTMVFFLKFKISPDYREKVMAGR